MNIILKNPEFIFKNKTKYYRCHMLVEKDVYSDGTPAYCGSLLNLPGAITHGKSVEELKNNMIEAATGLIESYITSNEEIPWVDNYAVPEASFTMLLSVSIVLE